MYDWNGSFLLGDDDDRMFDVLVGRVSPKENQGIIKRKMREGAI